MIHELIYKFLTSHSLKIPPRAKETNHYWGNLKKKSKSNTWSVTQSLDPFPFYNKDDNVDDDATSAV